MKEKRYNIKIIPLCSVLFILFCFTIFAQEQEQAQEQTQEQTQEQVQKQVQKQADIPVPDLVVKPDKVLLVMIKPGNIIDEYQSSTEIYKTLYLKPGTVTLLPGLKVPSTNTLKAGTIHYLLDPKDAESQKYLGDALFKKGEKSSAAKAYSTALKLDPEIKGVYRNYSLWLAEHGNPDNVIKIMNKLIENGEADKNIYLALGKIYQRKNNHKKAVETFEKILTDNPDDLGTLHALAVSKEKSGDLDGAIADLKKATSLNKDARDEYEFLGRLYTKQNSIDDAMQAYISFLDKEGKNQTIALTVGTYLYQKGKLKDAKKYLDLVKGGASKTSTYTNMIANCAFSDGEYENAIKQFKLSNTKKPALAIRQDNFKKLAESYLKLDDNKTALIWFDKFALINKTKDKDVSYLRAFLYEKSNPAKAKVLYDANLKAFPDDHRNYLQMGLLLSKNKATMSRSVTLLKKAVEVADTIPAVWLQIAQTYGKLKKSDEELEAYKKFLTLDPNNIDANIRAGTLLMDKDEISQGITYLKTANKADPKNAKAILVLSDGYLRANRLDEALSLLEGAKEAHKDNIEIQKKLVDVLVKMGKDQELIAQLKLLLEKDRDNETLQLYAQLLFRTGQIEEAKNACEDVLATDPENIEALMMMGSIFKKEQKYSEANDYYNEITIIDNQFVAAFYERGDLFLLQSKVLWAEKYFKKALTIDPDYALARLGLAKVALLHKDKKKYKEYVEMAYSLDPNNELIKAEYAKIK